MEWIDAQAERRIREAHRRGDFDDLPLAGKPLDLGNPDDPDWWLKRYLKDNGVSGADALSAPLALRREAQTFPESLLDVPSEAAVREILEDFNRRVRRDWLTPTPVPMPHARVVDVDALAEQWKALRRKRVQRPPVDAESTGLPHRGGAWPRLRRWMAARGKRADDERADDGRVDGGRVDDGRSCGA